MNEMLVSGWLNLGGFVAVLAYLWNLQRSLHQDIAGIHRDIADLRERMARLEGLFEGFTGRKETPAA